MGLNHRLNGLPDPTLTASERQARKGIRRTVAEEIAFLRREQAILLREIANLKRARR